MPNPVRFIDILSRNTSAETIDCDECRGSGEILAADPETGAEPVECRECLGTGYNQLGLILQGILKPPEEGYGPVAVREAIDAYLAERRQAIHETQLAITEAQKAITETQEMITQAQQLITGRKVEERTYSTTPKRRRLENLKQLKKRIWK